MVPGESGLDDVGGFPFQVLRVAVGAVIRFLPQWRRKERQRRTHRSPSWWRSKGHRRCFEHGFLIISVSLLVSFGVFHVVNLCVQHNSMKSQLLDWAYPSGGNGARKSGFSDLKTRNDQRRFFLDHSIDYSDYLMQSLLSCLSPRLFTLFATGRPYCSKVWSGICSPSQGNMWLQGSGMAVDIHGNYRWIQ